MAQAPHVASSAAVPPGVTAGVSAADSEKSARSPEPARGAISSAPAPKLRSCVVCRSRKVRCDKRSPCSNCRRANIPCVLPAANRPPRWAHRLERIVNDATANAAAGNVANFQVAHDADPGVNQVMGRLHTLEGLVKELTVQLEQARAAAQSASTSPESLTNGLDTGHERDALAVSTGNVQEHGRMILDANTSRYISSGFWSRVIDELGGLKTDTRSLAMDDSVSSEDEASPGRTPSTQELDRTPSERHAFLFRHNLGLAAPALQELHPLPSQRPFLLNIFAENVNLFSQIVHVPSVTKMLRNLRVGDVTSLTPSNEALLFSIYYAAITSMEEDDIMANFGAPKAELNLKYRLGLEHTLAKADFLNAPDIVLVQAFAIFLCLVRRHDSPRFVWMMTGVVIRMAQALGLHRDGAHFEHLTPYEVEIRRRAWWTLCILDVRASEDQGMDLTITHGSFDTKFPLNINDADIEPGSKALPTEREGLTDMSMSLATYDIVDVTQQMMAVTAKDGASGFEKQQGLLNEMEKRFERGYIGCSTEAGGIQYWVAVNVARVTMAKMKLLIQLPAVFSSKEHFADDCRVKLLVAAIEVAESNHALNAEQACRHWRWVFQTYTHWWAIVYLLIEISRRPWSPLVERAWVALHSSWLIPAQSRLDKNQRIWVPLRKLMATARKHRDAELERLQGDAQAAERLELEDQQVAPPGSSGAFPEGANVVELFRERWRQLVAVPEQHEHSTQTAGYPGEGAAVNAAFANQSDMGTNTPAYSTGDLSSNGTFQPAYLGAAGPQADPNMLNAMPPWGPNTSTAPLSEVESGQTGGQPYNDFAPVPADWSDGRTMGPGFVPWLWADADPSVDGLADVNVDALDMNMDLDGEMNWYEWIESANLVK